MTTSPPFPAPIRLIATDLDGTFLDADAKPSQANCDVVYQAARVGVPVVFATGRPSRWLNTLDPLRPAHPLAITSNGAAIVRLGDPEPLKTFPLDVPTTAAVIADVRHAVPEAAFAVEYIHGWGRDSHYQLPPEADKVDPTEADFITDDTDDLLAWQPPIKLLIRNGRGTLELMAAVAPVVGDRLNTTFSVVSAAGFLELSRLDVSKASTLAIVLDDLGIAPAAVAAFGDMPNDLPMLEMAGYPFIMDNAHDSLKQMGFPTCGHHDDSAFATTVRRLLGLS